MRETVSVEFEVSQHSMWSRARSVMARDSVNQLLNAVTLKVADRKAHDHHRVSLILDEARGLSKSDQRLDVTHLSG